MKAKAYWAGHWTNGGLIVAAVHPNQARAFVARTLFEPEDYCVMDACRVPAADALIDPARPIPHAMDDYTDFSLFYPTED
jgi:hypothetical protein